MPLPQAKLNSLKRDLNFQRCVFSCWVPLLYSHINHKRYTYAKTQLPDSNTGYSVVQVRTFINFLTSEFGSSTRGERDTILKSLSYHTRLTKLKRSAHLVELQISFHLRWSGPEKL